MKKVLPETSFGPVPWWAWNAFMEKEEMIRQLDQMRTEGIHEFFIYASYGLEHPVFLSEKWFEYVRFILDAARMRGMKVWFCDDLNWPSGTAGGHVLRDHPEYRMRNLAKKSIPLAAGESVEADAGDDLIWRGIFTEKNEFLRELPNGTRFTAKEAVRCCILKKELVRSIYFHSCGTEGTWNQEGYLDTLNPEAVRCWMGYIHEEYRKRFSGYFQSVIKGFFFDEPSMTTPQHTDWIPWTDNLESDFKSRYGYSLRPHLWRLFFQAAGSEQFRYDFWRLTTDRFAGAFSRQVAEWCAANRLFSTGHGWPEEPACQRLELNMTGDLHEFLRHHQIPGTDLLSEVTCCSSGPTNWYNFGPGWARNLIFSAKMPASTARYTGATRVLCEAFGVRDWNSTLSAQRRITDFLASMGINLINDNALQYSIAEFRKRGVSGKHFTQPWFRYYRLFAEYTRRICRFAASGRVDTEIAVLTPSAGRMAMTEISPDTRYGLETTPLPPEAGTAEAMLSTLDALVRGHRDFELIFDEVILKSRVGKGVLLAPNAEFKVILLPQCYVLNDRVARILSDFERSGGTLIAIGSSPGKIIVQEGRIPEEKRHLTPVVRLNPESPDFQEQLLAEIARVAPPSYTLGNEETGCILTALRRENNGRRLLLLANQEDRSRTFVFKRTFPGKMALFNPDDGILFKADERQPLVLGEKESVIAVFDDSLPDNLPELSESALYSGGKEIAQRITPADWKPTGKVCNTLLCGLEIRPEGTGKYQPVTKDSDTPFELDPDRIPFVEIRGSFTVEDSVPEDLALVFDTDSFDCLAVNGTAVSESEPYPLWDARNRRVGIAGASRQGINFFTARWKVQKWYSARYHMEAHFSGFRSVFEPVVLCGKFGGNAAAVSRIPEKVHSGDLREQGFPQFAGSLSLSSEFMLKEPDGCRFLELSPTEAVCEVELNGSPLGVRTWSPRRFDIPPGLLHSGRNSMVLTLTNSMGNLLRRHFNGGRSPECPFILPEVSILRKSI